MGPFLFKPLHKLRQELGCISFERDKSHSCSSIRLCLAWIPGGAGPSQLPEVLYLHPRPTEQLDPLGLVFPKQMLEGNLSLGCMLSFSPVMRFLPTSFWLIPFWQHLQLSQWEARPIEQWTSQEWLSSTSWFSSQECTLMQSSGPEHSSDFQGLENLH